MFAFFQCHVNSCLAVTQDCFGIHSKQVAQLMMILETLWCCLFWSPKSRSRRVVSQVSVRSPAAQL
jgi:hypothetical protein